jgi:hypothetical protein
MRVTRVRFTVRRTVVAVAVASVILVSPLALQWYERTRSVHLPSAQETEGIEVTLWGSQIGREDIAKFPLHRSHFASVLKCLSPAVMSESARRMMIFPPVGELRIRTSGGLTHRVVFVDAGKNPLCFTVDGVACLRERERADQAGYRADYRELYGYDAPAIDEAFALMDKLAAMCKPRDEQPPGDRDD